MINYDGWTQEISEAERLYNETETCLQMVKNAPQNEYWQKRLAYAIVDEIKYHQMLPTWAYLVPPEPAEFGSAEWFASVPMINPETGEMEN